MQHCSLPPPLSLLPWCPSSSCGPLVLLLSSPPPGGLPRPRGPDGAAGRDAADPALLIPLSVCQCFCGGAACPDEENYHPAARLNYHPCSGCMCTSSIQLHSPAPLYSALGWMCHYLYNFILHFTHQLSLKTVIWSLTHFEYHDHRLIYFFYFKDGAGAGAAASISHLPGHPGVWAAYHSADFNKRLLLWSLFSIYIAPRQLFTHYSSEHPVKVIRISNLHCRGNTLAPGDFRISTKGQYKMNNHRSGGAWPFL